MREYILTEYMERCPICDFRSFGLFETLMNRGMTLHNQICMRCGIVFLSPRMQAKDLADFYRSQYRIHEIENDKPVPIVVEKEVERAHFQVNLLAEWDSAPRRFLDIGSSSGRLLREASVTFDCVSIGVEPGEIYSSEAGSKFKIYHSTEELIDSDEPLFDVISLSHVLEHMPEPITFLSVLREHALKPNGALLIEVPNLLGHESYEPSHFFSFTVETLRLVLRAAGFHIKYQKLHALKQRGWLYISVLAYRSSPKPVPRRFVFPPFLKFKRAVGRSGNRHWSGYIYQQIMDSILNK